MKYMWSSVEWDIQVEAYSGGMCQGYTGLEWGQGHQSIKIEYSQRHHKKTS